MFFSEFTFLSFLSSRFQQIWAKHEHPSSKKIHRSVLFATISVYYFKSCEFLFICVDVAENPGPNPSGLFRFSHWNCNSLPAHNYQRISSIQAHITTNDLHLFAVTESALHKNIPNDQIDIPGFNAIRNDLPENDSHGGVLIFHRADLGVKHRLDLQNHANTLVLELSLSRKKVFFVLVYRKFSQTPEEFIIFTEKMDELLTNIEMENPYMTLACGDFSAHSSTWWSGGSTNHFGTAIQDLFDDHLLTQIVDQPTYITGNSQTCIDLVATDQPNLILTNEIHPSMHKYCHHQINFVKLNIKCPPPPPYERRVWHYGRADNAAIQRSLTDFNWELALSDLDDDPEGQVVLFDNVIRNVAENFIPFDDKIIKPRDPPWITKNSKTFYNKYRRQYTKFTKNGCKEGEKYASTKCEVNIQL